MPMCNSATLSTYHFPGIADIVGFFPNFSQFVYMPRQWGVHRNRNDLTAQGNATLAKTTSNVLLNTEKAPKQYAYKTYHKIWRGQLLSVFSEQKDCCLLKMCLCTTTFWVWSVFCNKRKKKPFNFCSVHSFSTWPQLIFSWHTINTGMVLTYYHLKFKLWKARQTWN